MKELKDRLRSWHDALQIVWNPVKELKVAIAMPAAATGTEIKWNPVKELKGTPVYTITADKIMWNPVKELKDIYALIFPWIKLFRGIR